MRFPYLAVLALQSAITFGHSYHNGNEKDSHGQKQQQQQQPAKNNRVLFLMNEESGLGNVGLATSHAILLNHPSVEVHYASFPKAAAAAAAISEYVRKRNSSYNTSSGTAVRFHPLSGPSFGGTLQARGLTIDGMLNGPGLAGQTKLLNILDLCMVPWTGPEYVALHKDIVSKIEDIDPAVIVIDTMLPPAVDAASSLGRKYIMLSANSLKDVFGLKQPMGSGFWKIPSLSSGFPYPVPWHRIPENLLLNARLIYGVLTSSALAQRKAYITGQGLDAPVGIMNTYKSDVPWISPSMPEIEYPLIIPANFTTCGPIFLSLAPVTERDPDLADWLAGAPTVLINLGSALSYNETDGMEMAEALKTLMMNTQVQVLWKFNKRHEFSDSFLDPIKEYVKSGRVRLEKWITVDPTALLESGHVVLSVHHGGANCFHEAIATGVPSVILPCWIDLYDYAARAEWLGVGIWPNKATAPRWTSDDLSRAFLRSVGDGEEGRRMRDRAKELAEIVKRKGSGRELAAKRIVEYMDEVKEMKAVPKPKLREEL